jgi:hypothetical protein
MALNFSTGQTLIASTSSVAYGRDWATDLTLPDGLDAVVPTPCLSLYNGGTELNRWSNNQVSTNVRLPPSLLVKRAGSNATVANNPFPFDTVLRDTANGWSAATFRYTIPISGWYRISMTTLQNNPSVLVPMFNGGDFFNGTHTINNVSYMTFAFETVRNCTAGDFFTARNRNGGQIWGENWTYACIDYIG